MHVCWFKSSAAGLAGVEGVLSGVTLFILRMEVILLAFETFKILFENEE